MVILPIGDDNTGRRMRPVVNYVLIAINLLVFFGVQNRPNGEPFTLANAAVPHRILTGDNEPIALPPPKEDPNQLFPAPQPQQPVDTIPPAPFGPYLTLLTSMFLHGGIGHLLGNMLFLWIFGDNIEDDLGRFRYLLFYLTTGVLAGLAHVFTNTTGEAAMQPCLGASGAISGVLGGYLLMHPTRKVKMILIRILVDVPAIVAIGLWFAMQIYLGTRGESDGVAYGAHIGGFIFGLALVKPFGIGRLAPNETGVPDRENVIPRDWLNPPGSQ